MSEAEDELATQLQRVEEGCQEAARQLHDQYGGHILRVVRRHLNPLVRPKIDSLDVLQFVWMSLFTEVLAKRSFDGPQHFVGFLTGLSRNKVLELHRHYVDSLAHDVRREQALDDAAAEEAPSLTAHDSAGDAMMDQEEWDHCLKAQPPAVRRLLGLLMERRSLQQAAHVLGVSERTAQRMLRRVRITALPRSDGGSALTLRTHCSLMS